MIFFVCATHTAGTRSVMMHRLELLERSARATREDEDEPENELGRGMREKHAKMYTDSESAEDNEVCNTTVGGGGIGGGDHNDNIYSNNRN